MKTIRDVFAAYKTALSELYDINETEGITLLTVSEITNLSKANIKAFPERELDNEQQDELASALTKLQTGMPPQYVLGRTEFYGLPFLVNSAVLIPRPETEELVEWIISSVGSEPLAAGRILDIGTGSGCIAISIKKNLPIFDVAGVDISVPALQIAKSNADLNQVNVDWIEGDALDFKNSSKNPNLKSPFSLIVSNPPYVTPSDKTRMHSNVTDFEPHAALFVPGEDPLLFYKAIADFALGNLTDNGMLFFEINESYGKETMDMLYDKGFKDITLRQDLSGKDRMVKATR